MVDKLNKVSYHYGRSPSVFADNVLCCNMQDRGFEHETIRAKTLFSKHPCSSAGCCMEPVRGHGDLMCTHIK